MFALRVLQMWLSLLSQTEEWTMLSDALASILMTGCNTLATTLYYICVGHIDKTVEVWLSLRTKHKGNPMLIIFKLIGTLEMHLEQMVSCSCSLLLNWCSLFISVGLA